MRALRFFGLFLAALASGCASTIEGASEPPSQWVMKSSGSCLELSGDYAAVGYPANANAHLALWPSSGSLSSILERGVNGPEENAHSIRIRITGPASMEFFALDDQGGMKSLSRREWRCQGSELVSRSPLSRLSAPKDSDLIEESLVRLWRSSDGALIAENSIESAKFHTDRPATGRRTLARFYFRFESVTTQPDTP